MEKVFLTVKENNKLTENVFEMKLVGNISAIKAPGQFVNLLIDGCYLRRPISVCDVSVDTLTLIYKVVGEGTERLSKYKADEKIDTLVGLGNGYDLEASGSAPLLIGGGVGVPPMYLLAKKLIEKGVKPTVILGFNTKSEVFYEDKFKALGANVFVATADGSYGKKGFVTDSMKDLDYTYFYTCGPSPMFKAIEATAKGSGEFSFEERMGCGFGACMGCSCKTKYGNKRICKDGPVLKREEIVW